MIKSQEQDSGKETIGERRQRKGNEGEEGITRGVNTQGLDEASKNPQGIGPQGPSATRSGGQLHK